jgi:4-methyl-5(b-hydroxyethyl)-thiazole monophosphate biosynthesis
MKTYVFLADGFEEIEAVVTIDILRRAEVEVQTISISSHKEVTGAHGISIIANQLFEGVDFSDAEMLILPGGMPGTKNLEEHARLKTLLAEQAAKCGYIAAICAAPSILGKMGLLRGKEAVCFPGFESTLLGASLSTEKVVHSNTTITAKGAGAATDFALKLVELLKGKTKALQIADAMCL